MNHRMCATNGAILLGVALSLTGSGVSFAQDNTVVVQPVQPVQPAGAVTVAQPVAEPVGETSSRYVPNRYLIGTGVVTFGLSYVPAVIIAAESAQPADHHLFVPIIGPWLDLGERPQCGVGSVACDTETTNKVLLAADGIFQGLGVLTVVAGFLSPEHERVVTATGSDKPTLHVTPAQVAGGYGLSAFGTF